MAGGFDSITEVKRSLKLVLEGSVFEANLAEIEIDLGLVGPAAVPRAQRIYKHELPISRPPEVFPFVELAGIRSERVPDESDVENYNHLIQLSWTFIGDREERLVEWVEAAILATRKTLLRKPLVLPGGTGGFMLTGSEDYSELADIVGFDSPFIKGGFIEVVVPTMGVC